MGHLFMIGNFLDESNESLIQNLKERTRVKEGLNSIAHICLDNEPEILKETYRNAIRPWSFVKSHLEDCLFNLSVGYTPVE